MREGRIPHSLDSERGKQPRNNPGGVGLLYRPSERMARRKIQIAL